jgi:ElaB/YqjD/DUF883 family membrane-anchored ribosome-binding protein
MRHAQHPSETLGSVGARAADAARHTAEQAAHAAEHYADRARDRARHAGEDLHRHADEGVEAARSFVQERPLAALGIAVLVGMIAVSLLRR